MSMLRQAHKLFSLMSPVKPFKCGVSMFWGKKLFPTIQGKMYVCLQYMIFVRYALKSP